MLRVLLSLVTALCAIPTNVRADMYCGAKNCYEVLGAVPADSDRDIKKKYHKLSLQYHPDKNDSEEANDLYVEYTLAYETLSKNRAEYDDMLEHPEKNWRNHFMYYRYKLNSKSNPVYVVCGFLAFITIFHWVYWKHRYHFMRDMVLRNPEVQTRKRQLEDEGAECTLENLGVNINGWQGRLPTFEDCLLVWLFFAPLKLYQILYWNLMWHYKFNVQKQEYGEYELGYLTAKVLKIPHSLWEHQLEEEKKIDLLSKKLWTKEGEKEYRREMSVKHKSKRSHRKRR